MEGGEQEKFSNNKSLHDIHLLIKAEKFMEAQHDLERLTMQNFPKKNQGEIYWMMHLCKLS